MSLSADDNMALMESSEFNYRRPWFSGQLSSLIHYSTTQPWGAGFTSGRVYSQRTIGQKRYGLSNHLGNVMVVTTDKLHAAGNADGYPGHQRGQS